MRAVVLLCLLHAALSTRFPWEGLDYKFPEPVPNTDNACDTDHGTQHCCAMLQNMTMLRTYFTTALDELEEEYSQAQQSLNTIEASRVAFSVALFSDGDTRCYGPETAAINIIYKHVFINMGDAYSTDTGIFTVPRPGVYSLVLTVYSDAGARGNDLAACVTLHVNNIPKAGSEDRNRQDQEDSTTIAVALHLRAMDNVTVSLPPGCFLCDDNSHYNTFSAFLLYPIE
ncbi:hypothetical protein ABVT39_015238 [Epinephelus coioides]